jgi:uncharacterized repeat protein (TIGR03803 family)
MKEVRDMKANPTHRIGAQALAAALASALALHGQTLNTLHSFGHNAGGYSPQSGVTVGPNGELYGTTPFGHTPHLGVAYELAPPSSPGGAWTEVALHNFSANDGQSIEGLLLGPSGSLYGVTSYNNTSGEGAVFGLRPPAGAGTHWREIILHAFTDSNGDGEQPEATPIFGPGGVLYGTTSNGGSVGDGTVYQLVPPGTQGGAWKEQILYNFLGYTGDGVDPAGPLALGSGGTIYGTTKDGGADTVGTVFRLTPPTVPNGAWTEALLYSFAGGSDSGFPNGLVLGSGGVLYGTTQGGNSARQCSNGIPCGTIFQLTPPEAPGGSWTETILHTFTGSPNGDGSQPNSTPVLGPGGVLYGTTAGGGTAGLVGTIYEMVPPSSPGGAWTEVILFSFPESGADGVGPNAVTLGPDGNLYGTTIAGGAHNLGTVFQLVLQ